MRRTISSGLIAPAIGILLFACGSATSDSGFASDGTRANGTPGESGGASPSAQADGGLPPEKEIESDYEAPVATGNVVWIANPKSGRVALVDATTLQVRTVEAGNAPTYLASVPNQPIDTTLVLNVLSNDATLLKATPQTITTATYKTAEQANSLVFSADGRFAIAWADARKAPTAPQTQGFQNLTVIDLQNNTSTILAVGYRPVLVGFAAGTPRAFAVTQDGVGILDLTGTPIVNKNVPISDTPTEDPGTRDVFVTKDGKRAFIRRDGSNAITVVDLDANTRTDITLTGPVTDLDVADTGDIAIAVVRDTSEVAVLPVADPTAKQSVTVTGEIIGSVAIAPGGNRALLYTNAAAVQNFSILDIGATDSVRTVNLHSPVLGVFATPDAQHAIILHDKVDAAAGVDASAGAFSIVSIGQDLPAAIIATMAPPTAVGTTNDRAIIAERDDAKQIFGAYLAHVPQLTADRYPLASPPIAVGVVANRAFVAQQHPEGRITFIDLQSGVARTLTGFELSSRVVDGSTP